MKILFDRYYPRLYYFALKLTRDEGEAQDEAQEALLALWQRKDSFKNARIRQAEAFMITIVRNRAYNFCKHLKVKDRKHAEIAAYRELSDDFLEAQIIQEDVFNRIYQEVQELPPAYVRLITMIFVDGLPTSEIAERLNTTANNVRNQKARALEKLRNLLLRKGLEKLLFFFFCFFYGLL